MDWGVYLARGAYKPIYHMCDETLFDEQMASKGVYYPPTYDMDGFIHATADPKLLLDVANHFYKSSSGKWICIRISVAWLDCLVKYEAAAPVGNVAKRSSDGDGVTYPHIYGGIRKIAVDGRVNMTRDADGTFTGFDSNF